MSQMVRLLRVASADSSHSSGRIGARALLRFLESASSPAEKCGSPTAPTALDSDSTLRRRLRHYAAPDLLLIDEVGYLSYSNRHADLLFELVSRRYQHKSTVVTTNKAFAEWGEVFPNAACVVSLVDRLMHRAEVVRIEGDSYRAKEAQERVTARTRQRMAKAGKAKP